MWSEVLKRQKPPPALVKTVEWWYWMVTEGPDDTDEKIKLLIAFLPKPEA